MQTIPFSIALKTLKTKSKLDKECKLPLQGELQTYEESDPGRLKKVENSPMHMNW
jgi:hypothetical protein